MELIADILLAAGALGAGFYCHILGRRLTKFNDLKEGIGGAVAVLSAQVDDLTKTLATAQRSAGGSIQLLTELTARAEGTARQLELQMASLHDVTEPPELTSGPVAEEKRAPAGPTKAVEPMFVRRRDVKESA